MDTVLFKFQSFTFKPEVCKMGGNFWLQNGLSLHCRLRPCVPRPFGLNLKPRRLTKYVVTFQKMRFFKNSKKFCLLRNFNFVSVVVQILTL